MLHVLLHLAAAARPLPSSALAGAMGTNPVVIRRILGGLRDRGLVTSGKGHGGGWRIACDLGAITLRDVYEAVGEPMVFAMGNRSDVPECLVEQAVNAALDSAFRDAEALLLDRFAQVRLATLAADFGARMTDRKGVCAIKDAHAA